MGLVQSMLGSVVGMILPDRPYWAVKLSTGKFACELDKRRDSHTREQRAFDWTLDLIDTDDILKIKELWLFCPPNPLNPLGQSARMPITEPGTAFQFKIGLVDAFGGSGRKMASQIIGRVTNKENLDCDYFVWDAELGALSTPMKNNLNIFQPWREGIAPPQSFAHEVIGLRL